jgi:putative ABC transport system permease protein
MFQNYLVTALRNITRHRLYSFINIAGLAVALTCVILVAAFVDDELSYDKWIPGAGKLWRVEVTLHFQGKPELATAHASMPMLAAMREQIPDVRAATRLVPQHMALVTGNRRFIQTAAVVDSNFLQVIPLPLMQGVTGTALSQPGSVVISQSTARKFFGDANPIGRTLTAENAACPLGATRCDTSVVPLKVTGVMRDLPTNTQFDFDVLVPNTSRADQMEPRLKAAWRYTSHVFGYVILAPGADPTRVVTKLKAIIDRSVNVAFTHTKMSASQVMEPRLTPFLQAHLTSDNDVGAMKPAGNWPMLYGLMVIGGLILLVACFNFMNLATARAMLRAREIALRKVVGASQGQLVAQFLSEAVLTALLAMPIAMAIAEILMPAFGHFMGRSLETHYFRQWPLTLGLVGICLLAGLLSGLYPALVLSSFTPAAGLRDRPTSGSGAGRLRALLVTLQFAVSIALGLSALVVFRQVEFAGQINLGFDRNNVVFASTAGHLSEDGIRSLVQTLKRGPGVLDAVRTNVEPFDSGGSFMGLQLPGSSEQLTPNWVSMSQNYFDLYHIRLVAGRTLSDTSEQDTYYDLDDKRNEGHNVMVNVALARALGYSAESIVGKMIRMRSAHVKVIGVVGDTLVEGPRSPAAQTVYSHTPEDLDSVAIRLAPGHTQEGVTYINRTLREFLPTTLPAAVFLDDSYEQLYQSDRRQGQIFAIFVAIAVFIACLGMFGLAAFTAGRRTREIGIRKVFGASTRDLLFLLLWQFSIPVLIANAIAWPVAWYWLHGWLNGFAYRITLGPLYFFGAGAIALVVAWATVFVHARRVANANPIHALRYE